MTKKTVKDMVTVANSVVEVLSPEQALEQQANGSAIIIDIRDIRELWREGKVDGASHVPRGMLEFWFDSESPYHKDWLADETKKYVLHCASGWRSALSAKTLQDMGFDNITHVDKGFGGLKEAGAKIEEVTQD